MNITLLLLLLLMITSTVKTIKVKFFGLPGQNRPAWYRRVFMRTSAPPLDNHYKSQSKVVPIICFDQLISLNAVNQRGKQIWQLGLDVKRVRRRLFTNNDDEADGQFLTFAELRSKGFIQFTNETEHASANTHNDLNFSKEGLGSSATPYERNERRRRQPAIINPRNFYFRPVSRLFFKRAFDPMETQTSSTTGDISARCWGQRVDLADWQLEDRPSHIFRWILSKKRYMLDHRYAGVPWFPLKLSSPRFSIEPTKRVAIPAAVYFPTDYNSKRGTPGDNQQPNDEAASYYQAAASGIDDNEDADIDRRGELYCAEPDDREELTLGKIAVELGKAIITHLPRWGDNSKNTLKTECPQLSAKGIDEINRKRYAFLTDDPAFMEQMRLEKEMHDFISGKWDPEVNAEQVQLADEEENRRLAKSKIWWRRMFTPRRKRKSKTEEEKDDDDDDDDYIKSEFNNSNSPNNEP
jgi:hypothetical protein